MKITGIEISKVLLNFSLTDEEADKISLALSICEMTPKTQEEEDAAHVLTEFAEMINELLRKSKE